MCASPPRAREPAVSAGEDLRRHIFGGQAAAAAAASKKAAAESADRPAACAAVSYATVAGAGDEASAGWMPGAAPGAVAGSSAGAAAGAAAAGWEATRALSAPRGSSTSGLVPQAPLLLVDGANVGCRYSEAAGGGGGFSARGVRLCVEYFLGRGPGGGRPLTRRDITVVLHERHFDEDDEDLRALRGLGVLSWTPPGKDDDVSAQHAPPHNPLPNTAPSHTQRLPRVRQVFLLSCAADNGSWVVTNDLWRDHIAARHATSELRRRVIRFTFMQQAFAPAADDLKKFDEGAGD